MLIISQALAIRTRITSSICPKTDLMTETKSVSVVKLVILSNPFNCCRAMVMAAPAMKPTMAAWERNSVTNPNLFSEKYSFVKQSNRTRKTKRCEHDPS